MTASGISQRIVPFFQRPVSVPFKRGWGIWEWDRGEVAVAPTPRGKIPCLALMRCASKDA